MGRSHPAADDGSVPAAPTRRALKVALDVTVILHLDGDLGAIPCPTCQASITVHQPDAQVPDQLLGTCESCGAWYVLGMMPDGKEAMVVHLPMNELTQRVANLA